MVCRRQRSDLGGERQHDLPHGPRARGRDGGVQLARINGIGGSHRWSRLHEGLGQTGDRLRGHVRPDEVRSRAPQSVPAVRRRRPRRRDHRPRRLHAADRDFVRPSRCADQPRRFRGGPVHDGGGRPGRQRVCRLGRHARPQRLRERFVRWRAHVDRAVAGERRSGEHERVAVDRRRRERDRRRRVVRHVRPGRSGHVPLVVFGPRRRHDRAVACLPGPGPT